MEEVANLEVPCVCVLGLLRAHDQCAQTNCPHHGRVSFPTKNQKSKLAETKKARVWTKSHFKLSSYPTTVNFLQKTVFQSNTVKYCPTLKFAHISATKRRRTESFGTNIGTISTHVCTNFQLKRLEPKADIVNRQNT